MDFSIYLKLSLANIRGKVKIKSKYRHLDFLIEKNWIDQLPDGTYSDVGGWRLPNYGDYYAITTEGKSELFNFRSVVITRLISLAALIISFLAFLFSLYK